MSQAESEVESEWSKRKRGRTNGGDVRERRRLAWKLSRNYCGVPPFRMCMYVCAVCIENYLGNHRDDGPPNTRRNETARGTTRDETEKGTTRRVREPMTTWISRSRGEDERPNGGRRKGKRQTDRQRERERETGRGRKRAKEGERDSS